MRERLIIGGIDFDQRLDDAKAEINERIEAICAAERRSSNFWYMYNQHGIFLIEGNPAPRSWLEEMHRRGMYTSIPSTWINLPPQA